MNLTKQTLYRLIQEAMEQPDVPELSPEEKRRQHLAEKLAEMFISGDSSTIIQAVELADALDEFHVEMDVEEEAVEGMGTAVLLEVYFYDKHLYPVVREMYQRVRDPNYPQAPTEEQVNWFFQKGVEYKWMDEEQYFSAQFSPLEKPNK